MDGNFLKLQKTQWENIETGISNYEKLVCDMMKTVGNSDSIENLKIKSEEKGEVIGEEIYSEILRPILKKNKFLYIEKDKKEKDSNNSKETNEDNPQDKNDKNNKAKGKKKIEEKKSNKKSGGKNTKEKKEDIILMNVNKEKLEKKLLRLLEIYSMKEKTNTQNYEIEHEDILEFKLIIFFLMAKNLNNNFSQETKENYLEAVIGLSSIFNKLKNHLENYLKTNDPSDENKGKGSNSKAKANKNLKLNILKSKQSGKNKEELQSEKESEDLDVIFISHITRKPAIFSETCLKDFEEILNDMKITVEYNPIEILTKFPKLLNYNIFTERYYKLKIIQAFDHQLQVLDLLKNSFSEFESHKKIKGNLIYLKTSIGSGKTTLAIAIASLIDWIRNKTKIQEYSLIFACSIDIVREYIGRMAYNAGISFAVATSRNSSDLKVINSYSCRDVKNVNLIITDYPTANLLLLKSKNYLLFVDEPTNKADEKESFLLKSFAKLFKNSPPNLILSSATLPAMEDMVPFHNYFKFINYPNSLVTNITAGYSFIGCEINDFWLNPYTPHHSCKGKNELLTVYQNTFDDPLLSRCYNSFIMVDLYDKMKKFLAEYDLKNFEEKMPDIKEYFSNIENLKYSKVVEMCKTLLQILIDTENNELIEKVCETDSCLFDYKRKTQKPLDQITLNKKPFDFNLLPLSLAKYLNGGCLIVSSEPLSFIRKYFLEHFGDLVDKISKMIEEHFNNLNEYRESVNFIKKKKVSDREKDFEISKLKEVSFFSLEPSLIINSYPHFHKYLEENLNKNKNKNFDQGNFQFKKPPIIDNNDLNLLYNSEKNTELILLLFSGVGILNNDNPDISDIYKRLVFKHAFNNELTYMIADENITYGANLPLNNIIIPESFSSWMNLNKLFQLIGRAGRIGQSWSAFSYLDENLIYLIDQKIKRNYFEFPKLFNNDKEKNNDNNDIENNSSVNEIKKLMENSEEEKGNFVKGFTDLINFNFKEEENENKTKDLNYTEDYKENENYLNFFKNHKKDLIIFNPDDLQVMLSIFLLRQYIEFKTLSKFNIHKIPSRSFIELIPQNIEMQLSSNGSNFDFLCKEYGNIYVFDIENNYFNKFIKEKIFRNCERVNFFTNKINNNDSDKDNNTDNEKINFINVEKGNFMLSTYNFIFSDNDNKEIENYINYFKSKEDKKINEKNLLKSEENIDSKVNNYNDEENYDSDESEDKEKIFASNDLKENNNSENDIDNIFDINKNQLIQNFENLLDISKNLFSSYFFSKNFISKDLQNFINNLIKEDKNNELEINKDDKINSEDSNEISNNFEQYILVLNYIFYQTFRLGKSQMSQLKQISKKIYFENASKLENFGQLVKNKYNFNDLFIKKIVTSNICLLSFSNENIVYLEKLRSSDFLKEKIENEKWEKFSLFEKLKIYKKFITNIKNSKDDLFNEKIFLGLNLDNIAFKQVYSIYISLLFYLCDLLDLDRKICIVSRCVNDDNKNKKKNVALFSGDIGFSCDEFIRKFKYKAIGNEFYANFIINNEEFSGWKII